MSKHHSSRRSKQRELVLQVLKGTKSHPTADDIYAEVKKQMPSLSLGTVYRNLKLLKEGGEIQELSFATASSRFDGNPENHGHFSCLVCGHVIDVEYPIDPEVDQRIAQQTGLDIHYHQIWFYGLCPNCQGGAA